MKPVISPLKRQTKRAEIDDLRQALSALGFTIAAAEKKNQRFGTSTRIAVQDFHGKTKGKTNGGEETKGSGVIVSTDAKVLP